VNLQSVLDRRGLGTGRRARGTADRLIAAAQRRLALTTLALLVVLLAAVGITTALLAERSLDAAVDRTLETAAMGELARIQEPGTETDGLGAATETEGTGTETESETGDTAATPAPRPTDRQTGSEQDDHAPAAADTFFLHLDASGSLLANPERIALAGLPDRAAAAAATAAGSDLRTVTAGNVRVRLLTLAVPAGDDATGQIRTLQAGFVLTLHDEQSDTLLRSILIVGLAGLLGAAVVSLILTRRALAPVRAAFDRERRFVAAASHELRTPIALIRGSAEVLGREGRVQPEGRALVADVVAEADRLGNLVAELSDLAVAQARPPAENVPIDLAVLAADIVRRARPMAEGQGIALEFTAPSDERGVVVRGDRDRLVQVALILLDNAVRHTPRAGVVRVRVAKTSRRFGELSVADEGPGIPAADRERIFEPFARLTTTSRAGFRSGASPESEAGGSGLGLAIARSLVTAMGGTVEVGDRSGGGAVFTVSLPSA
jgi:signal transduction histidine kinase